MLAPHTIKRTHLLNRLGSPLVDTMPRLTRLVAPAGYGKTTLLRQWIQDWQHQITILPIGIEAGLQQLDNASHDLLMLVSEYLSDHTDIEGAELRAAFRHLGQPCVLVLDQADSIPCQRRENLLQELLLGRNAPQNLRIIISGRTDVRHPVGYLTTTGATTRLSQVDLALSIHDIALAMADVSRQSDRLPTVDNLLHLTHGWATGVKLALVAGPGNHADSDWVALDDYIESLLRSAFTAPTRALLTATAAFPFLTADLWQAIASSVLPAVDTLHDLGDVIPFARWHDTDLGSGVSFIPIVANSLRRLGRRTPDTERLQPQAVEAAGGWLIERGRPGEAIALAAATQRWDSVLTQIGPHCDELGVRDDHDQLIALLDPVPDDKLLQYQSLSYWYLLSMMSTGQITEATPLYQRGAHSWSTAEDSKTQGRREVLSALWHIFRGDRVAALASARNALNLLPAGCHQERMRAAATCEVLSDHFGQRDEARRMFRIARAERAHLPHDQRWWVNFVLPIQADRLAMAADLTGAHDIYLHQLQSFPVELVAERGLISLRLALIDLERGELSRAQEFAHAGGDGGPAKLLETRRTTHPGKDSARHGPRS